jgi:hypothetical protein
VSNSAGNIMHILADLPDFLRKHMLKIRFTEFYEMKDEEKHEIIGIALAAVHTIDQNKLSVLFKTWLELLSELDSEKRAVMLQIYCDEILANPSSLTNLDFESLTATFASLDQKHRECLTDSLHEVLLGLPNSSKIVEMIPEQSLIAVGLK